MPLPIHLPAVLGCPSSRSQDDDEIGGETQGPTPRGPSDCGRPCPLTLGLGPSAPSCNKGPFNKRRKTDIDCPASLFAVQHHRPVSSPIRHCNASCVTISMLVCYVLCITARNPTQRLTDSSGRTKDPQADPRFCFSHVPALAL